MSNERPGLVLHICCAPDEAWAVTRLRDSHELHCFFCNPNIQPREEYDLRRAEARKVADRFGVPFSDDPYDPDAWEQAIAGTEHTGEGGERCYCCFLVRLRRAARFCRELGCPSFTSVMSVSPHKDFPTLCRAGAEAGREFGVVFASIDFKKEDGFARSVKLSRELGLYRQDYCGCRLSKEETANRRSRARSRDLTIRARVGPRPSDLSPAGMDPVMDPDGCDQ